MLGRYQVRAVNGEQWLTLANKIAGSVGVDFANPSCEARLHIGLPALIDLDITVEAQVSIDRLRFHLAEHDADILHPLRRELNRRTRALLHVAGLRLACRS